jgi:hypothetical protein
MFDPSFHPNSALLGSQSSQAPHSRHAILLAAYKARRRERLALERMAARTANRSAWRKFAAALGTLAARPGQALSSLPGSLPRPMWPISMEGISAVARMGRQRRAIRGPLSLAARNPGFCCRSIRATPASDGAPSLPARGGEREKTRVTFFLTQ